MLVGYNFQPLLEIKATLIFIILNPKMLIVATTFPLQRFRAAHTFDSLYYSCMYENFVVPAMLSKFSDQEVLLCYNFVTTKKYLAICRKHFKTLFMVNLEILFPGL